MMYDIRQVTTYAYEVPVAAGEHILRMMPIDRAGQRVIEAHLSVAPKAARITTATDFFGNHISRVSVEEAHKNLVVTLRARVAVDKPTLPDPAGTPAWERTRDMAATLGGLGAQDPVHYLFPSRRIPHDAAIRDYAAASFAPGRPVYEAALDLNRRIKADFAYDTKATTASTPVGEAFRIRRGVCQDFAHVMITGLRDLGLAAAYVSGFLRTIPPPGKPRLEGADATHAWVALWCGPALGWLGLDPTNAIPVGEDHVVVALGRDYADVSPIDGVVVAYGEHSTKVSVDVKPVGEPEIVPEKQRSSGPRRRR